MTLQHQSQPGKCLESRCFRVSVCHGTCMRLCVCIRIRIPSVHPYVYVCIGMPKCICMYQLHVCMYVRLCVFMHACMHAHQYECSKMSTCRCCHKCIHTCIYLLRPNVRPIQKNIRMYIHIYIYMYVCTLYLIFVYRCKYVYSLMLIYTFPTPTSQSNEKSSKTGRQSNGCIAKSVADTTQQASAPNLLEEHYIC